jgi:uncharacterized protein
MSILEAINDNDLERLQQIIEDPSSLEKIKLEGGFLLEAAIMQENPEIMQALIEAGALPDWEGLGKELLELAIMENYVDLTKKLVQSGAIINTINESGSTPLMSASAIGSLEIVKFLVENGANIDFVSEYGGCALSSALINFHVEIFDYLYPLYSPELRRWSQEESLLMSISEKNIELMQFLVEVGTDIDAQSEESSQWTALMLAVESRNIEIVKALLDLGANPNIQDENGRTALMLASKYRNDVEKGEKAIEVQLGLIRVLADAGANLSMKDYSGDSGLDLARRYGSTEIVADLTERLNRMGSNLT